MAVGGMGGREAQSVLSDPSARKPCSRTRHSVVTKDKLLVTGDKWYLMLSSPTIITITKFSNCNKGLIDHCSPWFRCNP